MLEYSRTGGISLVSEVINIISETPGVPKYGKFERLVDPAMRIS